MPPPPSQTVPVQLGFRFTTPCINYINYNARVTHTCSCGTREGNWLSRMHRKRRELPRLGRRTRSRSRPNRRLVLGTLLADGDERETRYSIYISGRLDSMESMESVQKNAFDESAGGGQARAKTATLLSSGSVRQVDGKESEDGSSRQRTEWIWTKDVIGGNCGGGRRGNAAARLRPETRLCWIYGL